jgi:general L-amino acid transport system permease protein
MERPPIFNLGPIAWIRRNLFSSWGNSLLTVVSAYLLTLAARPSIEWALQEANWAVITRNLRVLSWGRYPESEVWRLGACAGLVAALAVLSWRAWSRSPSGWRRLALWGWLLSPLVLGILLYGLVLPTPATIGNNIGYYIYRPDVLPALGQAWRASTALLAVAALSGLTWGVSDARGWRAFSGVCLAVVAGLNLPLGLYAKIAVLAQLGLELPSVFGLAPLGAAAFAGARELGRGYRNLAGIRSALPAVWAAASLLIVLILTSFDVGLEHLAPSAVLPFVRPDIWSGITLTLVLAVVSIVASFPIGVLLALGRRSTLPVVRGFCVLFIEIVRGVPLISILFMAQNLLPLFLPLEWTFDRVVRAMAGMTVFTAAYLAEVVRGGLQSVRHEQVEAARALGLSEILVTGLVVLPQALRAVIPAIMGQFVSVFKDTSLVAIVGLLDLLAISQSITKQREFLGTVREVYIFAGVFYFVISFGMSAASRRLERRLGVGVH